MEIKLNLSIKTIKKVLAMIEVDIPTDEKLAEIMEGKTVDLEKMAGEDPDLKEGEFAITLIAVGQLFKDEK